MKYFTLIFFSIIFLSSCSYQKLEFEKETGKVNTVKAGKKFCISLPEDHKTKFYWSPKHDYDRRLISYINSVFHGETVEFNFVAVKPGKTEMTFYLSGYMDTSQVKSFVVLVE